MKPFWLALCIALLSPLLGADVGPVSSKIVQVTVFTDQARVVREGAIQVPAGVSEWTFETLPSLLLDDSVQVSGSGPGGIAILDVTTRLQRLTQSADGRIQELETKLRKIERDLQVNGQKTAALEQQRRLLEKIESAATTVPTGEKSTVSRPGFDEWKQLLTFSGDARAAFASEAMALSDEAKGLKDEQQKARDELNDLRGGGGPNRSLKTVAVRISAESAGEVQLRISYAVGNAYWWPHYDARYDSVGRKLALGYFGQVRQSTGEDWTDVHLTLSTAKPGLGGGAPELSPWFIGVLQPRPEELVELAPFAVRKAREQRADEAKNVSLSGALAMAPAPIQQSEAEVQTGATSASFVITAPTSVLSDNSPRKVAISTLNLNATSDYQATPKLAEAAFLTAAVVNTSEVPLLPGEANVYLDENFVAKAPMKLVMPQEKFELALGADEGVAVKRKVVNRFHQETGITGKGRRLTFESLITVTNNKRAAQTVTVRDILPTSQDERIVVKLIAPNARDVVREEGGKIAWKLELKPGEKRELPFKFTVEHPADVVVTGLE